MEAKNPKEGAVSDQTKPNADAGQWVSPDVEAAMAGETVDFSMHIEDRTED